MTKSAEQEEVQPFLPETAARESLHAGLWGAACHNDPGTSPVDAQLRERDRRIDNYRRAVERRVAGQFVELAKTLERQMEEADAEHAAGLKIGAAAIRELARGIGHA